jgi:alkanesulfonate monooxygenase SsuD/methylene tetrahydromethanopterin reductase-like flavin-dependent oxidoreductase (luciferase family)
MIFGVGAGWNLEEMANHGTDPKKRFSILRERVEACKAMWTEEEASYRGRYVDFDRIASFPKPLQDPHPPVLVGGNGPTVLERVLAFGDGWFPNRIPPDDQMIERVEELQRLGDEAGRGQIPVTLQIPPRDPDVLRRYEEAGVTRTVHMLRPGDAADPGSAERKLDEWAERIQAYR